MIIANPIYDSVFKYLLEDVDIARELISTIIGEEIISIEVKPQETVAEIDSHALTVFRLDFKAIILTKENTQKKVLIELQKAKKLFDIMRFRRYLAGNYQKLDTIVGTNGKAKEMPLPIITIYFLGFTLKKGYPPVFRTHQKVTDVITGSVLAKPPKEPFVDLLNHESYTIQIPALEYKLQSRIEQVLMIFSPKYKTDDKHKLDYIGSTADDLVHKIINRLIRAASDEQVRMNMDVEDEVENTIANLLREKDEIIEKKDKALEVKDKTIEEKDKAIEEKDKALEEKDRRLAEQEAFIQDLKRKVSNNKNNE